MTRTNLRVDRLAPWLLFLSCCCGGCSSLMGARAPTPGARPPDTFSIEVHPVGRGPKKKQVVLQPNMCLQDALNTSGARFRKKDVYIVRTSPKTGAKHKLGANFDVGKQKVTLETDYAIHPDDVVIVAEDTSTVLDDILKGVLQR